VCHRQAWRGNRYAQLVASLEIGHDETAHRAYKALVGAGITSAGQLAGHSDAYIRGIAKNIGPRALSCIRRAVPAPALGDGPSRPLRAAAVRVLDDLAGEHGPLARALCEALVAAAEDVEWAERQNAKRGGDAVEVPSPTAEALLQAAQLYLETR
jgi:hypothetical protein